MQMMNTFNNITCEFKKRQTVSLKKENLFLVESRSVNEKGSQEKKKYFT